MDRDDLWNEPCLAWNGEHWPLSNETNHQRTLPIGKYRVLVLVLRREE